jgi:hypothetical protein
MALRRHWAQVAISLAVLAISVWFVFSASNIIGK